MKLVIFGLSVSSSWGNGHATLWRGSISALGRMGHQTVFFERDLPFYAAHRDLHGLDGGELVLYANWDEVFPAARRAVASSDAAFVTSYCPDAVSACDLVLGDPRTLKVFYDLDTPVTIEQARSGEKVPYVPPYGLGDFDLVLSFTGGPALTYLETLFGAKRTAALYGSVDPNIHTPMPPKDVYRADLSYLGTYAANRQQALTELFLNAARRLPDKRFVIAGAQYPQDFGWERNIYFVQHLPPSEHPSFYCSSRMTLNVTRAPMAAMGFCPSGRLFEAASCGTPVLTDVWDGLDTFFVPNQEILLARDTEDVIEALNLGDAELARIGQAAFERVRSQHTAENRARELMEYLELTSTGAFQDRSRHETGVGASSS